MLRKLTLGAAITASAVQGCELTMTTYAVPGCSVQLSQKVVTDGDQGKCNYAPNLDSYLVWTCSGEGSVDVVYYTDAACTQIDDEFTVKEGKCATDPKTGFFFNVVGDCCGFTEPMPGSGNADQKHYRHVQMKEQMHQMLEGVSAQAGRGGSTMTGNDNADEIHYKSVAVKEAALTGVDRLRAAAQRMSSEGSSSSEAMPGDDNADEIHYKSVAAKDAAMAGVDYISEMVSDKQESSEDSAMPGSDNADEIHYKSVALKQAAMKKLNRLMAQSKNVGSSSGSSSSDEESEPVLGGDSADEKHYRNAHLKRIMEDIARKTRTRMNHGKHMMHEGPEVAAKRFAAHLKGHHHRGHHQRQEVITEESADGTA